MYIHYKKASIYEFELDDIEHQGLDSADQLIMVPAKLNSTPNTSISALLIVELSGMTLESHPIKLEEHSLSSSIEQLVELIQSRNRSMIVPFLTSKVTSLEQSYSELKEKYNALKDASSFDNLNLTRTASSNPKTPRMRFLNDVDLKKNSRVLETKATLLRLLKEIQSARQLRDTETQTNRILEYRVVKNWDQLKTIRRDQGFISTCLKLVIKAMPIPEFNLEAEVEKEVYFKKEKYDLELSSDTAGSVGAINNMESGGNNDDIIPLLTSKRMPRKVVEFAEKKIRSEATRRLKATYPSQPGLGFRIEYSLIQTPHLECSQVIHPVNFRRSKLDGTSGRLLNTT